MKHPLLQKALDALEAAAVEMIAANKAFEVAEQEVQQATRRRQSANVRFEESVRGLMAAEKEVLYGR
jgi:hypothetical protein